MRDAFLKKKDREIQGSNLRRAKKFTDSAVEDALVLIEKGDIRNFKIFIILPIIGHCLELLLKELLVQRGEDETIMEIIWILQKTK